MTCTRVPSLLVGHSLYVNLFRFIKAPAAFMAINLDFRQTLIQLPADRNAAYGDDNAAASDAKIASGEWQISFWGYQHKCSFWWCQCSFRGWRSWCYQHSFHGLQHSFWGGPFLNRYFKKNHAPKSPEIGGADPILVQVEGFVSIWSKTNQFLQP